MRSRTGKKRRKHKGEAVHEGGDGGEQAGWVLPASFLTQDLEEFCSFMVPCSPNLPILPLANHLSLEQSLIFSQTLLWKQVFNKEKQKIFQQIRSKRGKALPMAELHINFFQFMNTAAIPGTWTGPGPFTQTCSNPACANFPSWLSGSSGEPLKTFLPS